MQNAQTKIWYEDESFWKTFGPVMFTTERIEGASEEIDKIIELVGIEKGARILDLCCGIGRHSLEFARRGCSIVGVDLTEEYLVKAREQADGEGLDIEFIRDDMRRFCQIESFDVVINMFTAFGYFECLFDDKRVLVNAYHCLRKGGKLIIDVMGKEVLAKIFQERDWHEQDGRKFLRESKISRDWSWCDNKWILLENGELKEFTFGHRVYSAVELGRLLKDCGFGDIKFYGDLDGSDYDHDAKRLIAIAQKE